MDTVLIEFLKENMITIGLILGVLKVLAHATPWAVDDEILQIITGFLTRDKGTADK